MSSNTNTKTFSAVGSGPVLYIPPGRTLRYTASVAGGENFLGKLELLRSEFAGGPFTAVTTATDIDDATGLDATVKVETLKGAYFMWRVQTFDGADPGPASDNVVCTLTDEVQATRTRFIAAGAVAGATAGFTVSGVDTGHLAKLPKNKTSSTLVIPITGLEPGETIVGVHLVGSVQAAAAKAASLSADLRVLTRLATGATASDASLGTVTAADAVVADTVLDATTAAIGHLSHMVAEGETFYLLVTGTTFNDDASTAELQAVALHTVPA